MKGEVVVKPRYLNGLVLKNVINLFKIIMLKLTIKPMKAKYLLTLVATFFVVYSTSAQEGMTKIPSTYDRSSITFYFMKFAGDKHVDDLSGKIGGIQFTDKYNNNNFDELVLNAPSADFRGVKASNAILNYLNDKGVGKQIISRWYQRADDGTMSMDLIFDRGMFNATDATYIKAQATKRGNSLLQDYGNRLIEKSYILILDYKNVQTMKEAKIEKMKGWKATVIAYLYKIQYDTEIQNALYDCWIYPEDTPEVKAEKIKKFNDLKIPVAFVTQTSVNVTASQPSEDSQLGKFVKQKSEDQLLMDLAQKGYDESLYYLEKNYEDFMVKTTIYQTKPIRAKIGKKEGLKCDNRYFAYEYVYDEKTNSAKPKFRGVIRATSSIVDNRQVATGQTPTSKFYQTAGRKLSEGYLLRQQNDFGIEFLVGFESGEVGGFYARADLRTGRFIGIREFFIYGEFGAQTADYPSFKDISFMHYGAGLAKGFMLTRNIELRPYVGLGEEKASGDDIDSDSRVSSDEGLSVLYLKVGANLALNLRHNIQLMGGIGSYSFIGNAQNGDTDTETSWTDIFDGREGASAMFGLKIMF